MSLSNCFMTAEVFTLLNFSFETLAHGNFVLEQPLFSTCLVSLHGALSRSSLRMDFSERFLTIIKKPLSFLKSRNNQVV